MSPRTKVQLAREHLERAQPEGEEPDLRGRSLEEIAAAVEAAVESAESGGTR